MRALKVQRCELGEPDEKGRRRPVPIEGAFEELPVEIVIEAIGNGPNPLIRKTTSGLTTTRHGTLVVDEATMMTTRKGVFAGGDIVAGASTVILAMGHGRKAAAAIDAYLRPAERTAVPRAKFSPDSRPQRPAGVRNLAPLHRFGDGDDDLVFRGGRPRNPGIQRLRQDLEAAQIQGTEGAALDRSQVQAVGRRELEARPPEREEGPAKVVVGQDSPEELFDAALRHLRFSEGP